jgi:ABC-2 type transport system permease protein
MTNNPIKDLSYRNYNGPSELPKNRWWAVAKQTMCTASARKGFWTLAALSGWWYGVLLAIFWFLDITTKDAGINGGVNLVLKSIVWRDQFIHGFSFGQLWFFIIALMIGTGTIANDTRSNAMLIMFSKPLKKGDYVLGKWLGVFIPMFGIMFTPMVLFYLYGAMSFAEYGFIKDNKWLPLQLPFVAMTGAAIHASLSIGLSSMFRESRFASIVYSALYFLLYIFTVIVAGFNAANAVNGQQPPGWVRPLFYCSVDGLQIGAAKLWLGTDSSRFIPNFFAGGPQGRNGGSGGDFSEARIIIDRPDIAMVAIPVLLIVAFAFAMAWNRVRAVEVIS